MRTSSRPSEHDGPRALADQLRHLDHLYVVEHAADEGFHRGGQGKPKVLPVERRAHGLALRGDLNQAFSDIDTERSNVSISEKELRAVGSVIVLEGANAAYPLELERLSKLTRHRKRPKRPQWLLLSVQPATEDDPERAAVWVADAYRPQFIKIFEDYLTKVSTKAAEDRWTTPDGNPLNQNLVANIARIRRAFLEDLWTSAGEPPRSGRHWWELWLDSTQPNLDSLNGFLTTYQLRSLPRSIALRDRVVVWVEATWSQLEILTATRVPLAEVRQPEFIDSIEDLPNAEQDEYVADLAGRLVPAAADAPAVCHLDSGVFRSHVLLRDSLAETDLHTIIGETGTDVDGHGTNMAGLALFGRLDEHLVSNAKVQLSHRLESVRMMPTDSEDATEPLDYGTATVNAIAMPEITTPRQRVFCLTLSTSPDNPGEPTLWSAAVDALAVGTDSAREGNQLRLLSAPDPDSARLIFVAAGNVDSYQLDHRTESNTSAVEDPAQAWNAVTVGAHTDLAGTPEDPNYRGWNAMAEPGELSPHSRTSVMFNQRNWPIKPDICMEGGNVLTDGAGMFEDRHPMMSLRTTGMANDLALASANATSAATAQAARLAALAVVRYPDYWPETIRGLLTHAAEWTPSMEAEVRQEKNKTDRLPLLRRYGWGVPTEDAVLNSSRQTVTLVTQDQFLPFETKDFLMRRFRLHSLPWPSEVLEQIGEESVRLRITLSYFIEPSASRRGWRQRYAYASHSLRFDLKGSVETQQEFIDRVNKDAAASESGSSRGETTSKRWLIGPYQRTLGSLHQDEWHGTGAELARCNSVAVYPVGGWWKNNGRADRMDIPVRYALLLSLRTDKQGIDLYTPIANQLRVAVPTEITTT